MNAQLSAPRRHVKRSMFRAARSLGVDAAAGTNAGRLMVFGHRVLPPSERSTGALAHLPGQQLEYEAARERLVLLLRHWKFVTIDEFVAPHEDRLGGDGRGLATLSFDDGYRDFVSGALPLLQELKIPATLYVTVEAMHHRLLLWFDRVYSALSSTANSTVEISSIGVTLSLATAADRARAADSLCSTIALLPPARRDSVVDEVVDKTGTGSLTAERAYLSVCEIRQLAQTSRVTIGSHSLTHPTLTTLDEGQLREELGGSRRELERVTGRPVVHLSYPNGAWNPTVVTIAMETGYATACATSRGGSDGYTRPRTNLGWWSTDEFAVRTSPFWRRLWRR